MSFDLDEQPLEEAAARALELFVQFYRGLDARRVDPGVTVRELAPLFAGSLGDEGVGLLPTLEEFAEKILPNSMTTPHPLYLGLVNCSPFPSAVLGDLLVSTLNNNAGAAHQSPAMTAIEEEIVGAFARRFGFPQNTSGMLLPGGTFATLQALVLARTHRFPSWQTDGPTAVTERPLVYSSQATHFSVVRAARVIGLGERDIRLIPGRDRGAMDVDALARRIEDDRRDGACPFAVVATLGTTGTGDIDPLSEIADVCRRCDLWFHVDACYGGAAILLDELRARVRGVENADTIAVDPQKWFFIPIAVALLLNRHGSLERPAFAVGDQSYIPHTHGPDAFLRGIPTSRRASSLPVWMALRAHGFGAVRDAVRRNIDLTRLLEESLKSGGFVVLPGGQLSVACARWEPEVWSASDIDGLQKRIASDVIATGRAWFSTVRHDGKTWLRFNMVNLHTREHHVKELAALVIETARRLEPTSDCGA
jgi:aromatic-L-amino-acid decarboxylase